MAAVAVPIKRDYKYVSGVTQAQSPIAFSSASIKMRKPALLDGFPEHRSKEDCPEMDTNHEALRGQVAVITGAGRGIGAGIARKLASLGASTVLLGRTRQTLETTASDISKAGAQARAIECD